MRRGTAVLALIVVATAVVWLVVLPRIAMTETVREREAWLERHRIDPAAMFYTDLELLDVGTQP